MLLIDRDPANMTAISDLSLGFGMMSGVLNQVYWDPATGRAWRLVYNFGADSILAGDVVSQATPYVAGYVSNTAASILDYADATYTRPRVKGIGVHTIATTKYGFVQVAGPCTNVTTDGNVVAGDRLTTTDGAKIATRENVVASGHFLVWGEADVADTGTVLTACELRILFQ